MAAYKNRHSSLFLKLIITFLIAILPVYGLSLMINNMAKNEINHQILDNTLTHVDYYLSNLETDFQRISNLESQFVNDPDLTLLSGLGPELNDYDKIQVINRLYPRLYSLQNSSAFIKRVAVKVPSISRIISPTNYIDPYNPEASDATLRTDDFLKYQEEALFLKWAGASANNGYPPFIIEVEISNDEIKKSLRQFSSNGGAVLVNPQWKISQTTNQQVFSDMMQSLPDFITGTSNKLIPLTVNNTRYMVMSKRSHLLKSTLIIFMEENELIGTINKYHVWIWIISIISTLMISFFSFSIYRMIHRPLRILLQSFKKVETGQFQFKIEAESHDEFGYLYTRFNQMLNNLKRLIDEVYVQKLLIRQSELKQLQSQINPHFLYNSFFILHRLIKYDQPSAISFSKKLGHYFQYITRNSGHNVCFEEEYQHAKSYTEIQKIRFSDKLEVIFDDLLEQYRTLLVPRLILQPIIENSFEHGLRDKVSRAVLKVTCRETEGRLSVIVEDNGTLVEEQLQKLQKALADEGVEITGLINVHRRLKLVYEGQGELRVSRSNLGGLKVELFFSKIEGKPKCSES